MKTFPTYDYTLCNTEGCKKKESCVRHLTYRKAQEENTRTASRYSIGKIRKRNVICM